MAERTGSALGVCESTASAPLPLGRATKLTAEATTVTTRINLWIAWADVNAPVWTLEPKASLVHIDLKSVSKRISVYHARLMDVSGIRKELHEFLDVLDTHLKFSPHAGLAGHVASAEDEIHRRLPSIELIAKRVDPRLVRQLQPGIVGWRWESARSVTLRLLGLLEADSIEAMLGPSGPVLSAKTLHRWVWEAAVSLWDDGYRREAIQKAATQVNLELQHKLGREDIDGTPLLEQAFSSEDPSPGKPRLRFPGLRPGTPRFKNAHLGAKSFGQGCFMAIRNLATHALDNPSEQVGLEHLAALSVLARWIEEAEVVATPTET